MFYFLNCQNKSSSWDYAPPPPLNFPKAPAYLSLFILVCLSRFIHSNGNSLLPVFMCVLADQIKILAEVTLQVLQQRRVNTAQLPAQIFASIRRSGRLHRPQWRLQTLTFIEMMDVDSHSRLHPGAWSVTLRERICCVNYVQKEHAAN